MEKNKERIISISPVFNEETRVGDFLDKFKASDQKLVDTILIINDGSTDSTRNIVINHSAKPVLVEHEKRRGLGAAIRTGVQYGIDNGYSIIVFIAPNGKDNPLEIPIVLKPVIDGKADYVQGSRYLDGGRRTGEHMPFIRRFATKLHPFLIKLVTGFPATDTTNGFRAIRREIFLDERINLNQKWLDTVSYEFYLYLMVIKLKYRLVEAPVTKIYKKTEHHFNYTKSGAMTKTRPIIDWWRILKPLVYYIFGVLK